MKALALAIALLAAGSAPTFAQTIASWTFETSIPVTAGPVAAEIGTGSAQGYHAGASTYSSPAGNGSAHSFSSNTWAVGDYYQFSASTASYSNIAVSWDQISSGTGPKDFQLSYSTDGLSFTSFASYTVLANASPNIWSAATHLSTTSFNYDLSSITSLNNAASVYFRLIDTSTVAANLGTVGTAGTDRVDNFTVTAIPEPSTYALLLSVAGFAGVLLRRRHAAVQL